MAEEYADKMARKTDAELRQYVTGRDQYRDDAVLAAFDELRRRGQPHPDEEQVRPALETAVQAQVAQEAAARERAEQEAQAADPAVISASVPELYSPSSIAIFSMLPMSMIGGGVLLGINLFRLGRKRALLGLLLFIVLYLIVAGQVLQWAIFQQGLHPFFGTLLFNVPAILVYLRWFWPRYVQTEQYRSRGIIIPILVSFAIVWGLQQALPYLVKQQPKKVQAEMEQLLKR
ncbi:hypothetical protein [Hymenobacter cellulosilyticus]|uniref:Uncharacterized protein n=1 Tax=Hymenobacter cellulosilyticus TaxID=2932248 RepID=A0A8T9Q8Q8_9BACT|nr:hypothetical protein [Hymenobacter cellulosilyticus]UOQ73515.1 hypothetical protein MUN79_06150 [Hymenobacter cellulosilyticus]